MSRVPTPFVTNRSTNATATVPMCGIIDQMPPLKSLEIPEITFDPEPVVYLTGACFTEAEKVGVEGFDLNHSVIAAIYTRLHDIGQPDFKIPRLAFLFRVVSPRHVGRNMDARWPALRHDDNFGPCYEASDLMRQHPEPSTFAGAQKALGALEVEHISQIDINPANDTLNYVSAFARGLSVMRWPVTPKQISRGAPLSTRHNAILPRLTKELGAMNLPQPLKIKKT